MHIEVEQFVGNVKNIYTNFFNDKKVLEVGSLNINGTVRDFFSNCNYLGIDLATGRGVDRTIPIHELDEPENYDVVISTEMLEHDKFWIESLKRMYSNLKSGGLLILTCAAPNRPEHGTTRTSPVDSPFTNDYYRNISIEDFRSVLTEEMFSDSSIEYVRDMNDLMFYGIKN